MQNAVNHKGKGPGNDLRPLYPSRHREVLSDPYLFIELLVQSLKTLTGLLGGNAARSTLARIKWMLCLYPDPNYQFNPPEVRN